MRPSKLACSVALVCAVCGLPATGAEPAAKPLEAPDAGISAALTNLSRPAPRKDGLKLFEEEISRSLQPLSPKGSFDGIMAPQYRPPPPRPIIQDRRPKEDADWRSQWLLEKKSETDGLGLDPFKSPNSARGGTARKNSLDELYDKLNRQGAYKQGSTSRSGLSGDFDLDENSKLPSSIRESAKSLREKFLGTDRGERLFGPDSSPSSFSDLFAPDKSTVSREQLQSHKDYVERFKEILNGSSPSLAGSQNSLNAIDSPGASKVPGNNALDSFARPSRRDAFASSPGSLNSVVNPTVFPDMSAQVLNQWNPLYTPPKADLPKPAGPISSPMWEAPRRRF